MGKNSNHYIEGIYNNTSPDIAKLVSPLVKQIDKLVTLLVNAQKSLDSKTIEIRDLREEIRKLKEGHYGNHI